MDKRSRGKGKEKERKFGKKDGPVMNSYSFELDSFLSMAPKIDHFKYTSFAVIALNQTAAEPVFEMTATK